MGVTLKSRQTQTWGVLSIADENQICCSVYELIWELVYFLERRGSIGSGYLLFSKLLQSTPQQTGLRGASCTHQDNRNAINTLISCTLEQIHCSPVHDALTSSFPPWLCGFVVLVAGPLVRCPMSHLGCSQTEIAVSLIAKRLVHVGGKNPCEEHAWYIKHSPLPVLNNNLIILSCVQRRRMLLILFNPLWVLN